MYMLGEQSTKFPDLFLRYLYYNITLNIPTCFGPQGTIMREPNQSSAATNQNSLFGTQLTCRKSQVLKM